jgi:hypothetical protein
MTTVAELLEEPKTVSFTLPRPKERKRKLRPPVVVRYIFSKYDKKPTYYFIKKADAELRAIIEEMIKGKDDMVMGDRNVYITDNFDTFVYRGIYTTTKF